MVVYIYGIDYDDDFTGMYISSYPSSFIHKICTNFCMSIIVSWKFFLKKPGCGWNS